MRQVVAEVGPHSGTSETRSSFDGHVIPLFLRRWNESP